MTNTEKHTQIDFVAANQNIVDNIELILDYFKLDYNVLKNRVTLKCPIHGSSREGSMNIFTEGRSSIGNFQCWTNHCESEIGYGVINLVKFLLEEKNGKQSYAQVIAFLEDLTGSKFATISADILNRRKFIQFVGKEKQIESPKNVITREKVRENLRIPSDYYIERNFLRETLDAYDVGNCFNRGKQMYMRCVVPCYNERFELVGAVGRSLNEQCSICETYHFKNKPCPSNDLEKRWAAKWINSDGFKSGHHFYNMQYAKKRIIDTQSVILVEGQGDIWRLHEAGIHNALGLFGLELTDQKFEILAQMDIMNIYLALDSDSAGLEAANKIEAKLSRYYNLERIRLTAKDIGDMTASEVKEIFKGVLI